jgi:hypothetical protein
MNKSSYLSILLLLSLSACINNSDSTEIDQLKMEIEELKQTIQKQAYIENKKIEEHQRELSEFNHAIKRTFDDEGYINYEFNFSHFSSISSRLSGSADDTEKKLINYGYIERGRYLGQSVIQQDLYELELTSKGRSMLIDTETKYYDDGSSFYRWKFKVGKGRFKEVIEVQLIDDTKAKVKFTCEIIEITKIGKEVFEEDDYIGEIKEYTETFVKRGKYWVPKDVSSFNRGWYR